MKLENLLALLLVLAFSAAELSATQEQTYERDPTLSITKGEMHEDLVLEVATPGGSAFVDLFTENDGPIIIPAESDFTTGIQLGYKFLEDRRLFVTFHNVTDGSAIQLIGSYELEIPEKLTEKSTEDFSSPDGLLDLMSREETKIHLHELASLGLENWSMQLTTLRRLFEKGDECCSCGSLYCCPSVGNCLGCGNCGTCCHTGGDGGDEPGGPGGCGRPECNPDHRDT